MRYVIMFIFGALLVISIDSSIKFNYEIIDYMFIAMFPIGYMCRDLIKAIKEKK